MYFTVISFTITHASLPKEASLLDNIHFIAETQEEDAFTVGMTSALNSVKILT